MQEAIKILNRKIESMKEVRDAWANDKEEDLSDEIADFDNKTAQLKAAIEVLQRKVKKDPRVDGLPDIMPIGLTKSKDLLLWTKKRDFPIEGFFMDNEWQVAHYGCVLPTDDILFYCDPDDIV